jgi:plasmid stabilization system protein ParE
MARVTFSEDSKADIREALAYTRIRFGPRKATEYRELLRDARTRLANKPDIGLRRPEIHPALLIYRIAQPGKVARHVLLYRIASDGSVHVARLLYDGMDFALHLPPTFGQE